jgi:hypothetical protein
MCSAESLRPATSLERSTVVNVNRFVLQALLVRWLQRACERKLHSLLTEFTSASKPQVLRKLCRVHSPASFRPATTSFQLYQRSTSAVLNAGAVSPKPRNSSSASKGDKPPFNPALIRYRQELLPYQLSWMWFTTLLHSLIIITMIRNSYVYTTARNWSVSPSPRIISYATRFSNLYHISVLRMTSSAGCPTDSFAVTWSSNIVVINSLSF